MQKFATKKINLSFSLGKNKDIAISDFNIEEFKKELRGEGFSVKGQSLNLHFQNDTALFTLEVSSLSSEQPGKQNQDNSNITVNRTPFDL